MASLNVNVTPQYGGMALSRRELLPVMWQLRRVHTPSTAAKDGSLIIQLGTQLDPNLITWVQRGWNDPNPNMIIDRSLLRALSEIPESDWELFMQSYATPAAASEPHSENLSLADIEQKILDLKAQGLTGASAQSAINLCRHFQTAPNNQLRGLLIQSNLPVPQGRFQRCNALYNYNAGGANM